MGGQAAFARSPGPVLRLPLEAFDYQTMPASVLNSGVSALTLHYVDAQHMLLTFSRRRLMARLPDDPPTDFDRNIDAVLVELPSGKVLARTSWRLHDAETVPVGAAGGELPDAGAEPAGDGGAAARVEEWGRVWAAGVASSTRSIRAIQLSPAGDLLTLQTTVHARGQRERSPSPGTRAYAAATTAAAGEGAAEDDDGGVQVDFFRISAAGDGAVKPVHAGVVSARTLVMLPLECDGLLTEMDQGRLTGLLISTIMMARLMSCRRLTRPCRRYR